MSDTMIYLLSSCACGYVWMNVVFMLRFNSAYDAYWEAVKEDPLLSEYFPTRDEMVYALMFFNIWTKKGWIKYVKECRHSFHPRD